MPTTQKPQQKHTKATQKVGGSAKKPVTKAMEGGKGKVAVVKTKATTGGGSAKRIVETVKGNMPVTQKAMDNDITNLVTEINNLKTEVTNIKNNINKINSETLNRVQFDIDAIIDAMDENTREKIYENQKNQKIYENNANIQSTHNREGKLPPTLNEYGMRKSFYETIYARYMQDRL